jgi:hypothetical protein
MAQLFKIGGKYRNRDGEYEVIAIDGDDMTIRYTDGRTLHTPISQQARIWENMLMEEEIAQEIPPTRKTRRSSSTTGSTSSSIDKFGRNFQGLAEEDFQDSVVGTTWRSRPMLGGLLAKRLWSLSGKLFESRAIYNRPEIHVYQPQFYVAKNSLMVAKFQFVLKEAGVRHGFYVEKGFDEMDDSWDWLRFLDSFRQQPALWKQLPEAMTEHNLEWVASIKTRDGVILSTVRVSIQDGKPVMQDDTGRDYGMADWGDFEEFLRNIDPEHCCDLHLLARIEKSEAIALGVHLAEQVAQAWHAQLPLYLASVQRK